MVGEEQQQYNSWADDLELFATIDAFVDDQRAVGSPIAKVVALEPFGSDEMDPPERTVRPVELATTPDDTKKHKKLKKESTRRPRRVEVRLLQDEIARLEALQAVLANRQRTAETVSDADASALTSVLGSWKQAADRELSLREDAVTQNLELRKQVRGYSALVDRITKQLRQLQTQASVQLDPHGHWLRSLDLHPHRSSVLDEPSIYMELLGRIPGLYRSTGQPRDHDSKAVDTLDTRIVPFETYATAEAAWMWRILGQSGSFWQAETKRNAIQDDTVDIAFHAEPEVAEKLRLRCRGRCVARRFVEADRVVIVTAGIVEKAPAHDQDDAAPANATLLMRLSQWIVVERLPSHKDAWSELSVRNLIELDTRPLDFADLQHTITAETARFRDTMYNAVDNAMLAASMAQRHA